jgi:hypothetical protein
MPPKKDKTPTLAVAYVAKCTRCGKKHGPQLNELCLALLPIEQPEEDPENAEAEEEALLVPSDAENPGQENNQGATASSEAGKDAYERAVTAQLTNMAASLASLSAMFLETRNEVAQLKAEAAVSRQAQS